MHIKLKTKYISNIKKDNLSKYFYENKICLKHKETILKYQSQIVKNQLHIYNIIYTCDKKKSMHIK